MGQFRFVKGVISMNEETNTQNVTNFMKSDYGDSKMSKTNELNSSMTINATSNDELTNKLKGGF